MKSVTLLRVSSAWILVAALGWPSAPSAAGNLGLSNSAATRGSLERTGGRYVPTRVVAQATRVESAAEILARQIFGIAEGTYPLLFPKGPQSTDGRPALPFIYRYYPSTGNYLGIVVEPNPSFENGSVYVMGTSFGAVGPIAVGSGASLLPTSRSIAIRPSSATTNGNVAAGDFDGDGNLDLAYRIRTAPPHPTGEGNYFLRFHFGDGRGGFNRVQEVQTFCDEDGWEGDKTTSQVADFNGDGIDDYVCTAGRIASVLLYKGGASIELTSTWRVGYEDGYRQSLYGNFVVMDVNLDGKLDLVELTHSGTNWEGFYGVLPNLDGLSFSPFQYQLRRAVFNQVGYGISLGRCCGAAADFDGDGRKDIVSVGSGAGAANVILFARLGSNGKFIAPSVWDTIPSHVNNGWLSESDGLCLTYADVDGDGDVDLVLNSGTDYLQVMLNNGQGRFTEGPKVKMGLKPTRLLAADFDQDGNVDLLSFDTTTKTITIAFGLGGGTFGSQGSARWKQVGVMDPKAYGVGEAMVGDFNKNGFPDVVFSERTGQFDEATYSWGTVRIVLDIGR